MWTGFDKHRRSNQWIKIAEIPYVDGVIEGLATEWHLNGKKVSEGKYEAGKKTGAWISWHDNGKKSTEGGYEGGLRVGDWQRWHVSGVKASEGAFKKDHQVGLWSLWDEEESILSEITRDDSGNATRGIKYEYHPKKTNREVDEVTRRVSATKKPLFKEYNVIFDKDGKELLHGNYTIWHWAGDDETPRKAAEGDYRNGLPTGLWEYWDAEGYVVGKITYDESGAGKGTMYTYHRKWVMRTAKGGWKEKVTSSKKPLKSEYEVIVDKQSNTTMHGSYTEWHWAKDNEKAKKSTEGKYEQGQKHGSWPWWNDAGKLLGTTKYDHGKVVR